MYEPLWPAYVTNFSAERLVCEVAIGDAAAASEARAADDQVTHIRREYRTVESKRRLHQDAFRFHVLRAYDQRCGICRLHEPSLLEAAHIVPDRDEQGVAEVPNGLSLCLLHHGAFDANLLGIDPDLQIHLAPTLLSARDGPTLEALKGFKVLHPPARLADQPRRELLDLRFAAFRNAISG